MVKVWKGISHVSVDLSDPSKTFQVFTDQYTCHLYIYIYMNEEVLSTSIISPPLSSCVWQNFPVLQTSFPPSIETVHCVCGDDTREMHQNATKADSLQRGQQTLSFLPSMVVISASLPMVKELVTVFLGVLEVTTKSLPFCLISVIGLMSLAILMTSSGSSGDKNTFTKFSRWKKNSASWFWCYFSPMALRNSS